MRVNFNVINQKNVPALQSGTVLPTPGQVGRIFYNAAGVGIYIDNGIEWLLISTGSGEIPGLQAVTNEGNETSNDIGLIGSSLIYQDGGTAKTISGNNLGGPAADYPFSLPDASGVIPVTVNGIAADNNGNITLPALPYLVFTALLTQQGASDPQTLINTDNGNIVPGVTYKITNYDPSDDFLNVGAPSNANGVDFLATGTTASSWSGTSELNYNNGAPVAKVLQNTIGKIWFEYIGVGVYYISCFGLFELNKTWAICPSNIQTGVQNTLITPSFNRFILSTNELNIANDNLLDVTPIEIRVYTIPV